MLSLRTETILKSIVGKYISQATPVPSQSISSDSELGVSAATIRNEMAYLEQEGYITRPHTSSGSIPSDKGYRCYVESLGDVHLPLTEQRLINHLFHQVERELDEWTNLATTLIAQMVQNAAIITIPKPAACQIKHLELVGLQDFLALIVLVLSGAHLRQQLIAFDQITPQEELTSIANKLSAGYTALTAAQILARDLELTPVEQQVTDCVIRVMEAEDEEEHEEHYLDGLHFVLNQPEFTHNQQMTLKLMELIEQRNLLKSIRPPGLSSDEVQVIIGTENRTEAIQDYSVVIAKYGLPEEAVGTIGVIGPTRMPYARTIATISYLASILSELEARLYGKETQTRPKSESTN